MKHFYSLLFFAATALTTQAAETIYECPLNTQEQANEWTYNRENETYNFSKRNVQFSHFSCKQKKRV